MIISDKKQQHFYALRHNKLEVTTPCSKKGVHQYHIYNLVNSQRIFKILSLTHSAENYENLLKID